MPRRPLPDLLMEGELHDEAFVVDFNPLSFAACLRVLMRERDLTIAGLAALSGLAPDTVAKMRLEPRPGKPTARRPSEADHRTPTPISLMHLIRGMNTRRVVPDEQVVQLFMKCGYAPPFPFIVSTFDPAGQVTITFDTRRYAPRSQEGKSREQQSVFRPQQFQARRAAADPQAPGVPSRAVSTDTATGTDLLDALIGGPAAD